ncbi:MAG: hypothetical protein WBB30_12570, partial [Solirubrobacterales bacterium]
SKGRYLHSVTLTSTMGPGIKIDTSRTVAGEILAAAGMEAPEGSEADSNGQGSAPEPTVIAAADAGFEVDDPDAEAEEAEAEEAEAVEAEAAAPEAAAEAEAAPDDSEE